MTLCRAGVWRAAWELHTHTFPFAPPRLFQLVPTQLGEFWFQLLLNAEPVGPDVLPELSAELGGRPCTCPLTIDNPLPRTVTVMASSNNQRCFKVTPTMVSMQQQRQIAVHYMLQTQVQRWKLGQQRQCKLRSVLWPRL